MITRYGDFMKRVEVENEADLWLDLGQKNGLHTAIGRHILAEEESRGNDRSIESKS